MPSKHSVKRSNKTSKKRSASQKKHQARAKAAFTLLKSGKVKTLKQAWTRV
jgi:hypothetical protein